MRVSEPLVAPLYELSSCEEATEQKGTQFCLSDETRSPDVNRGQVASSFLRAEFLANFLQCLQ